MAEAVVGVVVVRFELLDDVVFVEEGRGIVDDVVVVESAEGDVGPRVRDTGDLYRVAQEILPHVHFHLEYVNKVLNTWNVGLSHRVVHNFCWQMKLRKGYVFTSVCQEFCPQWGGVHPLGRHSPRQSPLGRHLPGQTPPQADGYCSGGQYASYWNVFLLPPANETVGR